MDTSDRVREIIEQILGVNSDDLTDGRTLVDMGADSLDVTEVLIEIETEFDLTIPEADANCLATVGDFVKYIESRLG